MDLHACSMTEINEAVNGSGAASRGEPFNPHQSPHWIAGYRFWMTDQIARGSRKKSMTGLMLSTRPSANS